MKYDIFISYRRGGGKDVARMLKESLTSKGYNVFLDFDELKDGYFDEKIMHAIDEAPVFILVLSKGSMDRCVEDEDWVRKEIEYALSKDRQIVPIDPDHEFDGFPEAMPVALREEVGQHQFSVLDTGQLFNESLDKIDKNRLSKVIRRERIKRYKWLKYVLAIGVTALLILGGSFFVSYLGKKHCRVGVEYMNGECREHNIDLALKHFKISAALGNAAGQYNMGLAYITGNGVEISDEKAYTYFLKSYKHANDKLLPLVSYFLGIMAEDGSYCGRDLDKAFAYFYESASLGEADAQFELAKLYYSVEFPRYNLDSAFYWFHKSADQDNVKSCFMLGSMYLFGQVVDQDAVRGLEFLKKSARLGDLGSANLLFSLYETQESYEDAFYYASMSADKGDAEGLYNVGRCYYEGKGVDTDELVGVENLIKSAKTGNELALQYLQTLGTHYATAESIEKITDNVEIRLVSNSSHSTTFYLRFTRKSILDMTFVVDGQCFLEDAVTGVRYKLLKTQNCKVYPDVNQVINDDIHEFVLQFEKLPVDAKSLTLVSNDYDKVVKFSNIQLQYAN